MCSRWARNTPASGTPWYAGMRSRVPLAAANAFSRGPSPSTRSVRDSVTSSGIAGLHFGGGIGWRCAAGQLPVQRGELFRESRARVALVDLDCARRAEARAERGIVREDRETLHHLLGAVRRDEIAIDAVVDD